MKILGIDPSSSICGIAFVEDNKLFSTDCWVKPNNKSAPEKLVLYYEWLRDKIAFNQPDIAVIEFLSVERNAQATRLISQYQGISALACKLEKLMVIEARVSSARKAALGNGSLSKQKVYPMIKDMFPNHQFKRADKGGYDEADAVVLACGGIALAEM